MKLTEKIRTDINLAIEVWQEMLNNFLPEGIEYIFTKGSSTKTWESDIDYVPRISDVDIHVKLTHSRKKVLSKSNSFNQALFFTKSYEENFSHRCQEEQYTPLHLPRVQLVQLDLQGLKGYVVPPREKDVRWIQGKTTFPDEMEHALVRAMDRKNLRQEKFFIDSIPEMLFEMSGLEYYSLFYKLNSKISPTPIRLLTQLLDENPHDIWAMNKTSVKWKLKELGYEEIANNYEKYFLSGWNLFELHFSSSEMFLEMITNGYWVLKRCFEEINKI